MTTRDGNWRHCLGCMKARRRAQGARCPMHAGAKGTLVEKAIDHGRPGEIGPVPFLLAGGDATRPVP